MANKQIIPSSVMRQIKETVDLVQVVSSYIPLNKNLKAICPFHSEKTPSFSIMPNKKRWYCFGCGASGDVISFIQKINKLNFLDAVYVLANNANIALPKSERFKDFVSRKWDRKKKALEKIEIYKVLLRRARIEERDQLLEIRRELHKLPREEWSANDYLKEQLLEYQFDLLYSLNEKIERMIESRRREIING